MKDAILTIAAISAMSLAGCTVYTHRPVARVHVEDEPATVTYEETAPEPAPIVEVEPARPYYDAVWVRGHWVRAHHRWVWIHGYWR